MNCPLHFATLYSPQVLLKFNQTQISTQRFKSHASSHPNSLWKFHRKCFMHLADSNTNQTPRRQFLTRIVVSLATGFVALTEFTHSQPASADRTGKFSTKLTAKRRYLPRIELGSERLGKLKSVLDSGSDEWKSEVNQFVNSDYSKDLSSALTLFATTYFSEGNKISALEKELQDNIMEMNQHLEKLKKAVDIKTAQVECTAACKALNEYLITSKFSNESNLIQI